MSSTNKKWITIPDLGTSGNITVAELLVKTGDTVKKHQPLLVLEGDKASMEVEATESGQISAININTNDPVVSGQEVIELKLADIVEEQEHNESSDIGSDIPMHAPDVGATAVLVSELLVSVGDTVQKDDVICVFESDKATMEFTSPVSGLIKSLAINVGDEVVSDQLLGLIYAQETVQQHEQNNKTIPQRPTKSTNATASPKISPVEIKQANHGIDEVVASPIVRRLARDFGISLSSVKGTGRFGRITKEDIKAALGAKPSSSIDPNTVGATECIKLTKIQNLSANHLTHCWQTIPHVTQHDDLDIDALEQLRKGVKSQLKEQGIALTPLVFLIKSLAHVIEEQKKFRSVFLGNGEIAIRDHIHIGVAVDTEEGLVVPVIKDVLNLSIHQIAKRLTELSSQAKKGSLAMKDMQGAAMTISSLGAIGGRYFTPIINAPEVAILGVSKAYQAAPGQPLLMPVSLSYDHRVIDGVYAVKMLQQLNKHMQTWCHGSAKSWMKMEEKNA
ncbi:MAG: 2-oxo acid dehydrogenase subunit E2 [Candidatus Comchoanobacterales bacterium]